MIHIFLPLWPLPSTLAVKIINSIPLCRYCEPGKFTAGDGKSLCLLCPTGIAPAVGSTECQECPPTQVADADRLMCGCGKGKGLAYPVGQVPPTDRIRLSISEGEGADLVTPTFEEQGIIRGRLEIERTPGSGDWGTVRHSENSQYPFEVNEAKVACHVLGIELGLHPLSWQHVGYWDTPDGNLDCFLDDLDCEGTEDQLGSCMTSLSLICDRESSDYDVGVR